MTILVPPTSIRVDADYWHWFFVTFVSTCDVRDFYDRFYHVRVDGRIRISGDLSCTEDGLVCAAVYLGIPLIEVWPYDHDQDTAYFS